MGTKLEPRKIFNYDNFSESKIIPKLDKGYAYNNTISAAGCLFYKKTKDKLQLLLISYSDPKWNDLDDFGGRVDESDDTVYDTIIRETVEETNNIIDEVYLQKKITNIEYKPFYNNFSKYYVIAIEVDDGFYPDTKIFGNFEKADCIGRTIKWYNYSDIKNKISSRIKCNKQMINFLDEQSKK
jgi:hypothetical protein